MTFEQLELWVGSKVLWLMRNLANGRPMVFLCHCFLDRVSGRLVNLYLDMTTWTYWFALHHWSWLRVPCKDPRAWLTLGGKP